MVGALQQIAKALMRMIAMIIKVAPLAATAGQPVKLTLWSGYPEMKPYFDAAAKFYNELHPNVTIEVSTFPLRDIERKYAVSLPTNSGPDIAETHIYIAQMHIDVRPRRSHHRDGTICGERADRDRSHTDHVV